MVEDYTIDQLKFARQVIGGLTTREPDSMIHDVKIALLIAEGVIQDRINEHNHSSMTDVCQKCHRESRPLTPNEAFTCPFCGYEHNHSLKTKEEKSNGN
jgi:predicted RNA-binding Zn-ribbon protein involved in translation (DUF1610 family)